MDDMANDDVLLIFCPGPLDPRGAFFLHNMHGALQFAKCTSGPISVQIEVLNRLEH